MIIPGQYIRDVKVEQVDARGAALFSVQGDRCFVPARDVPLLNLRPGEALPKLVCIGFDPHRGRFRCALPGRYREMARQLYFIDSQRKTVAMRSRWRDAWLPRWQRVVLGREPVLCRDLEMDGEFAVAGVVWLALSHREWELPVPADALFAELGGDWAFFPAIMECNRYASKNYTVTGRPAHRDDGQGERTGSGMRAVLRIHDMGNSTLPVGPDGRGLPVTVRVGGPRDPKKYHFAVRKHCFPEKKHSRERLYWKEIFAGMGFDRIPGPADTKKIFNLCCSNTADTNCMSCHDRLYRDVHGAIRVFLHAFFDLSVTMLRKKLTEKTGGMLIALEHLYPGVHGVQAVVQDRPAAATDSLRRICVYRGLLWHDNRHGVLLLNPLTQYAARRAKRLRFEKNLIAGTLSYVQDNT